ncbi:MAG: hypothetical protein K9H49_12955 [Bacteroidales bacterium]|nr:hypothetical protein [Bacteroidales bacterium]MCF8390402.1 hypothetical protein [Bacteroidales bacterium]
MNDHKNFEGYREILSGKQLTETSGGYIPVWLLLKIIEWGDKFDQFIEDNVKVTF